MQQNFHVKLEVHESVQWRRRIQDSLWGGGNPQGAPIYMILSKFPKNCMKSRQFWTVGSATEWEADNTQVYKTVEKFTELFPSFLKLETTKLLKYCRPPWSCDL